MTAAEKAEARRLAGLVLENGVIRRKPESWAFMLATLSLAAIDALEETRARERILASAARSALLQLDDYFLTHGPAPSRCTDARPLLVRALRQKGVPAP